MDHQETYEKRLVFDGFEGTCSKTTVFIVLNGYPVVLPPNVTILSLLVKKVMRQVLCFTLLFDMGSFGDFWTEK